MVNCKIEIIITESSLLPFEQTGTGAGPRGAQAAGSLMQPGYSPQPGHVNHAPNVPVSQASHHAAPGIPSCPPGTSSPPGFIDRSEARQSVHVAMSSSSSHDVTCALSNPPRHL